MIFGDFEYDAKELMPLIIGKYVNMVLLYKGAHNEPYDFSKTTLFPPSDTDVICFQ